MSEKIIIWVHGDNLNPNNIALTDYPDAPAIFIWDDALLDEWQISLKRIVFMYECLLELPVVIRRGDVITELLAFADEHDATRIIVADSPSPLFTQYCNTLEKSLSIEIVHESPYLHVPKNIDLKRFSRFWRKIKDDVMYPRA